MYQQTSKGRKISGSSGRKPIGEHEKRTSENKSRGKDISILGIIFYFLAGIFLQALILGWMDIDIGKVPEIIVLFLAIVLGLLLAGFVDWIKKVKWKK